MKIFLLLAAVIAGGIGRSASGADIISYPLEKFENPIKNQGSAAGFDATPFLLYPENFIPAVSGNGMRLFGMADGLTVTLPTGPAAGVSTVSLWFRPERLCERMTLASFFIADEQLLALKIERGRLNVLDWSDPKQRHTEACGPELELNAWHHVIWAMDGSRWTIWLDGKKVCTFDSAATPGSMKAKTLHLGNDFHPAVHQRDRFVGTLDEFRWSDAVPDEAAITREAARIAQAAPLAPPVPAAATAIKSSEKPIDARFDVATQSFVFNGVKEPVMIYAGGGFLPSAGYAFDTADEAALAGMNVFRTTPEGGRDFCGGNWWYGDDRYDFSIVDRNLDLLFRQNPNAKILLALPASPPAWWGYQYPEEQCCDSTGRIRHDYYASHSYSSQKWLADLEKAWTAFFEHIRTTPYYNRIIGYVPISGRYGECLRAGYNSQLYGKEMVDYSKPELLAFRNWLKQRYGTIAKMRQAYRDGKVPDRFDDIALPTPAEHTRPDSCYFPDPVTDRAVIDYRIFVNDQSATAVCAFTATLRKLAGPDKIIGLYYGYVLEDALGHGRAWASDSGHMAPGKVLNDAPIDFLAGPVGYHQRELGSVGPCMGAAASVELHNKLWLDEADIRTSLNGRKAEYSGAADLAESLAVLWRTFGNTLVNRAGLWWFPIAGGQSYSDPAIWRDFGKMYQEMRKTAEMRPGRDRRRSMALIVDPMSIHFRRYSLYDPLLGNLLTSSRDVFAKAGVESDYYLIDDIERIPDDYPVYIFLNSFYLNDAQRAVIARRFKKDHKLLVWTYGAGYFRNAAPGDRLSVSPANIADLTGIKVEWLTRLAELKAAPAAGGPIAVPALSIKGKYNPAFFITDSEAQILAAFTGDPQLEGKGAVAFKTMNSWRSVYLGVPEFNVDLVRGLAQLGGAHVWTDADNVVVRPGNGHLLIHSGHDDTVKITLPQPAAAVIDVATGEVVARQSAIVMLPIGKNRTRLLRIQ